MQSMEGIIKINRQNNVELNMGRFDISFIYTFTSETNIADEQSIELTAEERARNLFAALDVDGNGLLDMDEFIAG